MERKAKQVCVSRVSRPIVGSNVTIIIIIIIMSSFSTGDSAGGRKGRKGKDVQAVNLEGERESQL